LATQGSQLATNGTVCALHTSAFPPSSRHFTPVCEDAFETQRPPEQALLQQFDAVAQLWPSGEQVAFLVPLGAQRPSVPQVLKQQLVAKPPSGLHGDPRPSHT